MIYSNIINALPWSNIVLAVIAIAASIAAVLVVTVGCKILLRQISGDRVFYGGQFWDRDVYDEAMHSLGEYKKRGGRLSREDKALYQDWRDENARDGLF